MSKLRSIKSVDVSSLLREIKARIQQAQTRAVLHVNSELVRLYWDIGRLIHVRQLEQGWGAAVIPRLANELQNELPEKKGLSERNLKYVIRFYREYASIPIVQQPAAQLGLPKSPQEDMTLSRYDNTAWGIAFILGACNATPMNFPNQVFRKTARRCKQFECKHSLK